MMIEKRELELINGKELWKYFFEKPKNSCFNIKSETPEQLENAVDSIVKYLEDKQLITK